MINYIYLINWDAVNITVNHRTVQMTNYLSTDIRCGSHVDQRNLEREKQSVRIPTSCFRITVKNNHPKM